MISIDTEAKRVASIKIIDFGTSVLFEDVNQFLTKTTPEYMPPEVLNHIDLKSKMDIMQKMHPWSIDIWSLGIVIIEMVLGFPIYMAYKSRITREISDTITKQSIVATGLLACSTRESRKIFKLINTNFSGHNYIENIFKKHRSSDLCLGNLGTNK